MRVIENSIAKDRLLDKIQCLRDVIFNMASSLEEMVLARESCCNYYYTFLHDGEPIGDAEELRWRNGSYTTNGDPMPSGGGWAKLYQDEDGYWNYERYNDGILVNYKKSTSIADEPHLCTWPFNYGCTKTTPLI